MAYTTIDDPSVYFQTTLYTGNGSNRSITNTGNSDLQPDLTWLKARSESEYNFLYDVVRGATKGISSDLSAAEATYNDGLTAFGSDGFSLGTSNGINRNGTTYVTWNWKAGTSFTNDASSTGIGGIDSAGSFNNTSGISIVTYNGNAGNTTVKHGMNVAPKMIWFKRRDANSTNWYFYHASLGQGKRLVLNATTAEASDTEYMNNTAPTTSVFSLGPSGTTNTTGNHLAYCFADVKGYSKFGSYAGNNNADGAFVYTGFKPAWIMIKGSNAGTHWTMYDNKRDTSNVTTQNLRANSNGAETTDHDIDMLSNGFKHRGSGSAGNGNYNYIYMAFAENPFVTSSDGGSIPTTAR